MTEVLFHAAWIVAGAFVISAFITLAAAILTQGELRGGLEAWNDSWWQFISGGRWNAEEEDFDGGP